MEPQPGREVTMSLQLDRARAARKLAEQVRLIEYSLSAPLRTPERATPPAAMPDAPDEAVQAGLFGETRVVKAKKATPAPALMFSQRDVCQFGVKARPFMPLNEGKARLGLTALDPRTDEERERDLRHAAESLTAPMFGPEMGEQTRAELDAYHALCDSPTQEQP
jgi:hypothetical protein